MSLSKECQQFCKFLAEQYSGSSKVVAFLASESPVDVRTVKSFFREMKANQLCNPKNLKCNIGETFYFELTDEGSDYLNSIK